MRGYKVNPKLICQQHCFVSTMTIIQGTNISKIQSSSHSSTDNYFPFEMEKL